jgi:glyoxylase-like metal-dependent hydrolase (beta-lactamase superfamily II)
MANCIIHPIPIFESKMDKSLMTYRMNFGQTIRSIGYVWYIEGLKEKILVDAGGSVHYLSVVRGLPSTEIQRLDTGLRKIGLNFHDIDLIIFTHLHNDHVAEARQFPRAKFLVQKGELEFAKRPHPSVALSYHSEFLDGINFEVVNGDTKICEEISVLFTPGHTPGSQSVSVKTAQGTAIITGLCTIRENYAPPLPIGMNLPVVPPGMHTNVIEAYDSIVRIKELADIIVPNHDPEFQNKSSIP